MSRAGLPRTATASSVTSAESNEKETQQEAHVERTETCPECDGTVVPDSSERICQECGLIVGETRIDPGPEWRASSAAERDERARVGAPTTDTLHDGGLTTKIGWRDRDVNGNSFNSHQHSQLRRIRRADRYTRTSGGKEESSRDGLGEIQRMSSALGLSQRVRECSASLYNQSVEADVLPGWSREAVTTAVLHITLQQFNNPRDIEEIMLISQASKEKVLRARKQVLNEFELWESVTPDEDDLRCEIASHITRLVSNVGGSNTLRRAAKRLLDATDYDQLADGRKPISYAAACVFEAGRAFEFTNAPTQQDISEAGGPCPKTIRTAGSAVIDNVGDEALGEIPSTLDKTAVAAIAKRD